MVGLGDPLSGANMLLRVFGTGGLVEEVDGFEGVPEVLLVVLLDVVFGGLFVELVGVDEAPAVAPAVATVLGADCSVLTTTSKVVSLDKVSP